MIGDNMNFKKPLNQISGFILVLILVYGCGYTNRSLISHNINSIYIPIFDNLTFRRGIEFDLTKAIKNEIMTKTNLRIVNKEDADTVLYGRVKDFKEVLLTQDVTDNIVESRVALFVDFKLVDRRTNRTLIAKENIKQDTEFIVRRGETLESATEEGILDIAETIVNCLEEKW